MAENPDKIMQKIAELSEENQGLLLGEVHWKPATLEWLKNHMQELKELGYTRLYIEHVEATKQEYLDNFMADMPGAVEALHSNGFVEGFRHWTRYMDVLQSAKEAGIKIVGIDTPTIAHSQEKGLNSINYNEEGLDYRNRTANPYWKKIIKGDMADAGKDEKYLVWCGLGHSDANGGIDTLLGIPSIDLLDGATRKFNGVLDSSVPAYGDLGSTPSVFAGNASATWHAFLPYDVEKFNPNQVNTARSFDQNEFHLYSALTFNLDPKALSAETRKELQDVVDILAEKGSAFKSREADIVKEVDDLEQHLPPLNMSQAAQFFAPKEQGTQR